LNKNNSLGNDNNRNSRHNSNSRHGSNRNSRHGATTAVTEKLFIPSLQLKVSDNVMEQRYTVAVIGDTNTGKSIILTGGFTKEYMPTVGATLSQWTPTTNYGVVTFDLLETNDLSTVNAIDGALIFFDVQSRESYNNLSHWRDAVRACAADAEVVKVDIKGRVVRSRYVAFALTQTYYDISAKSNYNYEKPIWNLSRSQQWNRQLSASSQTCAFESDSHIET
jgi:GTP-binding nuclear protein Ran